MINIPIKPKTILILRLLLYIKLILDTILLFRKLQDSITLLGILKVSTSNNIIEFMLLLMIKCLINKLIKKLIKINISWDKESLNMIPAWQENIIV